MVNAASDLPLLRWTIVVNDPDADPAGSEYEQLIATHRPDRRQSRSGGMFLSSLWPTAKRG